MYTSTKLCDWPFSPPLSSLGVTFYMCTFRSSDNSTPETFRLDNLCPETRRNFVGHARNYPVGRKRSKHWWYILTHCTVIMANQKYIAPISTTMLDTIYKEQIWMFIPLTSSNRSYWTKFLGPQWWYVFSPVAILYLQVLCRKVESIGPPNGNH
jgi:hypothetical protein